MDAPTIELKDLDVKDIVAFLQSEHKMIIRSDEQDSEFVSKKVAEEVGKKLSEWATNLEGSVAKNTAIEKEPNEKAMDYLERAITAVNSHKAEAEKKVQDLTKSAAKGDSAAEEIQKQFDTFKTAKEKEISELTQKVQGMEGQAFEARIQNEVNAAMTKIRPQLKNDEETKAMREAAIENEIRRFYESTKAVDLNGALIYHDQNDDPIIDKTTGNHLGAHAILSERLKYLVDEKRVQGGNGSPTALNGVPEGESKKIQLPDTVQTQVQLTEHLKATMPQLDPGGKEFNQIFMANREGLKLK